MLWWNGAISAPSADAKEVRFTITRGASAETIGKNLKEAGIIKDTLAFKLYLQSKGLTSKLPPGQFRIPRNLTMPAVVDFLMEGPAEFWVTIPEGYRREQIPSAFIKSLELSGAAAEEFEEEFLEASGGMEGFLYPDTYLFAPDVSGAQAVALLRATFDKKFSPTPAELSAVGLTLEEVVTLASIIERETKSPKERPVVAGIYFNRLDAGWPLQVDATLQYAIANVKCRMPSVECSWWEIPTAEDKEFDSRYNTYKYPGLPPGPIANPGLTSLEAVINPEDTPYWYYIHDSEGVIHYAETLEEHNRNVTRYLR